MNKTLSTLIEISEVIRDILKRKLKMKLILDFHGNGKYSFHAELGDEATVHLLNIKKEEV